MTAPDAAMIFAAGFGTRMGTLTRDRPKPLIEVAGQSLLDRALDLARDAGVRQIAVNTHYRAQDIADHLAGRDIGISHEAKILDTGGGLRAALPTVFGGRTQPMFTLNPDILWHGPNPLTALAAAWEPARMGALVMVVGPEAARARTLGGDFAIDARGRVSRGAPWIYCGAQIIDPTTLAAVPDDVFSLNRVWDDLIAQGRLCALPYDGIWCDVGTPEALQIAQALAEGTA